jgi:uncharacterized protein (DUF58 family)
MKSKPPVRLRSFGFFIFFMFIIILAAAYFPGLQYLLFILVLYLIISIINFFLTFFNLKFTQDFSTDHPVKGESFEYTLNLSNETFLPATNVEVSFISITPSMEVELPGFSAFILPGSNLLKKFIISCPYRGIYTIGLQGVEVEDLFHFFMAKQKVWSRTFHVYPRILELRHFYTGDENINGGSRILPVLEKEKDYSLFNQLKDYRHGEPIRDIYWKKFALTGIPYIKEYDTATESRTRIFFDLSRVIKKSHINPLEVEDTSVEILIALVKYFIKHSINVAIKAQGRRNVYNFEVKNESDFNSLYQSTSSLTFQSDKPLAMLYRCEMTESTKNENIVFFITHVMETSLFNLIDESIRANVNFTVVLNLTGYNHRERTGFNSYISSLRNNGARIIIVQSSKTIIEDLESYRL